MSLTAASSGGASGTSTRARRQRGRETRASRPRAELATLETAGRDPLGVLDDQNATRVEEYLPIREERMAADEFSFFRGGAAIMAADLAAAPHSGILVPSCGDAHVANFGFYASPQRSLLFDVNDFDEAAWAPWEWDVKRLVTSVVIAGRATDRAPGVIEEAARSAIRAYRFALATGTSMPPSQRYFTHYAADTVIETLDKPSRRALTAAIAEARGRTGERAVRKLTHRDEDGRLRFVEHPPTMTRTAPEVEAGLREFITDYRASAGLDVQILLDHYEVADVIRRVVGVGSVGTRCALVLFHDGDGNSLILQAKQAEPSVLQRFGGIPQPAQLMDLVERHGEGARAVSMQRTLQAFSDPFLGYLRALGADMYVRQFHDMKGGIDATLLEDGPFVTYARACAVILARAHVQSSASAEVVGYIGRGGAIERALLAWSYDYADVVRADYRDFVARPTASAPGV